MEPGTNTPVARGDTDPFEAALLRKAQRGDSRAFDAIVTRYQRRVYATAMRIVRRHDVADDVAQEAFIRAHQALASFDAERPFGPWICRISANLAFNHVRSPKSREEELPEGYGETPATGAGPLDGLLDGEARAVLDQALGHLSGEQRAVFTLRVMDELSYREIADALQISLGTVMSRLSRARERLRSVLQPYLGSGARTLGGEP